jgi:hypothetical protein
VRFAQEAGRVVRFGGAEPGQWLVDLVDYVEHFDPDVREHLEGASPEEIAELERLSGLPLPDSYRAYLEAMGRSSGGILYDFKAHLDIGEVLELYRDSDPSDRPEGCLMIGRGIMGMFEELSLRPMPEGEPQVVRSDDDQIGPPIARSFPRLLLQQAFLRYELGTYPVRQEYGLQRKLHTLQRVQRAATAVKFAPYWFSDGYNFCGWAEGAAVGARQLQGAPGWLIVGGVDSEVTARLSDALDHALGMRFQKKLVELPD